MATVPPLAFVEPAQSNAASPISALPSELFIQIFNLVANDDPPTWSLSGYSDSDTVLTRSTLGFVKITQVCRHWRAICHGARELWDASRDPSPEEGATLFVAIHIHRQKPTPVRIPDLLPALRVLSFSSLRNLPMTSMLDVLARTPLLEVLHFHDCHWSSIFDETLTDMPKISLPQLASLSLKDIYTLKNFSWYDYWPLEYLHERLDFPSDTVVTLSPWFNERDFEDGRAIPLLRRLITRVMAKMRSGSPSSSLGVHIAWSDPGKAIHFTSIPMFSDLAIFDDFDHPRHREFWRATIELNMNNLEDVLFDSDIIKMMEGVEMLSISTDRITRTSGNYLLLERALFQVFSNIRILRILQTTKNNSTDTWLFLHELAEFFKGLRYPHLEEIWISPITSATVDTHIVRKLAGIAKRRLGHPENQLRAVRVGIPRPSAVSEGGFGVIEEFYAVELENMLSSVVWAALQSDHAKPQALQKATLYV